MGTSRSTKPSFRASWELGICRHKTGRTRIHCYSGFEQAGSKQDRPHQLSIAVCSILSSAAVGSSLQQTVVLLIPRQHATWVPCCTAAALSFPDWTGMISTCLQAVGTMQPGVLLTCANCSSWDAGPWPMVRPIRSHHFSGTEMPMATSFKPM